MTEELARHEVRGERATIDDLERPGAPGSEVVKRPGDELLAGPRLADDQGRDLAARRLLDLGHELTHRPGPSAQIPQLVPREELHGGALSIGHPDTRVPEGEGGARRDRAARDPDVVDDGAVGRAVVDHLHASGGRLELHVIARHRGIGQDQVVVLRGPDHEGLALGDRALSRVGPFDHLDPEGPHGEMRRGAFDRRRALGHERRLSRLSLSGQREVGECARSGAEASGPSHTVGARTTGCVANPRQLQPNEVGTSAAVSNDRRTAPDRGIGGFDARTNHLHGPVGHTPHRLRR